MNEWTPKTFIQNVSHPTLLHYFYLLDPLQEVDISKAPLGDTNTTHPPTIHRVQTVQIDLKVQSTNPEVTRTHDGDAVATTVFYSLKMVL